MSKTVALGDIPTMTDGAMVTVMGSLRALQLKRIALGEDWAVIVLVEDGEAVTVLILVRTFATVDKTALAHNVPVRVTGRVSRPGSGFARVIASSVQARSV